MSTGKLTTAAIKNAKAKDKPYKMSDGGGMFLLVKGTQKGVGKYWRMDYRFEGRRKTLPLGVYPDVGLKEAREARDEARKLVAKNIDPSAKAKEDKAKQSNTFKSIAEEWIEKQEIKWSAGTISNVKGRMKNHLYPYLGKKPIDSIQPPELLETLRRIEQQGKIDTAHEARQNFGQIARYAIASGRAIRDISQELSGALTPLKVSHRAALKTPNEAAAFMMAIDDYHGSQITRIALAFSAYTFARPKEVRYAEWAEIDELNKLWRVPASKMKKGRSHVVPLSTQVLALLEEIRPLTGKSKYIFPSERTLKRPMSENTVNGAIRRLGYSKGELCAHGLRGMASTLLNEKGYNRDWIERQLAHVENNEVRAAYNHAQYLSERRKMMQDYSDYLDSLRDAKRKVA